MGFFEFVWLFSLTVLLPLAIVKITTDYKRQRLEMRRAEQGQQAGLTIGELKQMLREVAEEANQPLVERMGRLENGLVEDLRHPAADPEIAERTVGRQRTS